MCRGWGWGGTGTELAGVRGMGTAIMTSANGPEEAL